MKYLFIYLQLLILVSCNTTQNIITQKDKIGLYYQSVHKAELALIKNNFEVALNHYLSADQNRTLFAKDAINALTSSIEIKKYNIALKFTRQLIEKGIPYSYFEKKIFFKSFIQTKEWRSLKNAAVKSKVNLQLSAKVDSLLKRDQEFRSDYNLHRDTIIAIDTLIKNEILAIFTTHGYPNTALIGITMRNDTTIKTGWNNFDILLIHQIKNQREFFIPILEKFLYNGQMNNKSFESHSKNFHPINQYKLNCLESVQGLFIQVKDELFTCCCKEEEKIDLLRQKYYLEPLVELRQKAEFHYEQDRRFGFGGYSFKYSTNKGEEDLLKIKEELLKQGFILHKKLDSERAYHKK